MVNAYILVCPMCLANLKKYDKVKRKVKGKNGKSVFIFIDRYYCPKCRKVHRALPEYLWPYKQYERFIIEGIINGTISNDILDYEDYPCENTIKIWRRLSTRKTQVGL